MTDRAATLRPSTLTRRMSAISVIHQSEGHLSPTHDPRVRSVLSGIRRIKGVAPQQARPLTIGELRRMIAHLPASKAGIRDRALLLVGFAGALRRSELVGLDVADLEGRDEGYVLLLRRSKSDQEGQGRRVAIPRGSDAATCPVAAIDAWLEAGSITDGPMLRGVTRYDVVQPSGLSDRSVPLIIKRAATAAGVETDGLSGHSLRAGFATTAAAAGASERQIAHQTGHRSMEVLRGYVRHGGVFIDNAATLLGL